MDRVKPRIPKWKIWLGSLYRWYLADARHPLRDKFLGRWWRYFSAPRVWVHYVDGLVIRVGARDLVQQKILLEEFYEKQLVDWLRQNLNQVDVFWDVGANIGAMSLVAATRCRQVVAFEPDPASRAKLNENILANDLQTVRVIKCALSDRQGSAEMTLGPETNTGQNTLVNRLDGECERIQVETETADNLIAAGKIPQPSVMKIDVEGAELQVLSGAAATLRNRGLRAVIFETREGPNDLPEDRRIVDLLERVGFQIRLFGQSEPSSVHKDDVSNFIATR